jgi:hypothetical protein
VHEKPYSWPYVQKQMLAAVNQTLDQAKPEPEFKGFGAPTKIG